MFILLVNYCFTLFECLNSSWNKNHRKRKSNNKKLKKRIFCIRKKIRNPHFLALDTARRSSPPDPSVPWSSTETPRSPEYAENLSEPDWQRPCLSRSQAGNLCQRSRPLEEYQPPLGFMALLSPGHVFLLHAIEISSRTFSPLLPLKPTDRKSTRNRWTSVPPESKGTS